MSTYDVTICISVESDGLKAALIEALRQVSTPEVGEHHVIRVVGPKDSLTVNVRTMAHTEESRRFLRGATL